MSGGRHRSAVTPHGSHISFYLLAMTVCERQDGANTALETDKGVHSKDSWL